ncbi:hydrogenase [Photobacterium iliopiscarium]|jgi:quinone-reactive Ni/Fe-hydrogenase small subunit|uniref:hydrogenase (acceptor) n=1 Tax=Photobacterium iliopiscarium TaxID=56192 RepID=A0A0D8PWY6_9GAMM|nr:hydrogenase small subunit [Photobacterium iliopiscarium]KJG13114.1 hydrogenase [Photobacterium iliopiscarium]KJG22492.1 hydrogenase [Photobacterium iliopiscarium]PST91473.1 hydrogenase [Photobacterium iliopiscarium]PSU00601.1 hydrogenase [Photobacterium iliopiscarium]PSV82287.1 hydrogenase [Photobacterium iliopiscarium]
MDSHAALFELGQKRLAELRKMKPLREGSFQKKLEQNGITRRDFMIWSATITSLLALPLPFSTMVAEAAELSDRVPLIWLSLAECTGCSESLVRSTTPDISTLLFEHVSLEYQEVLMAAAGDQAEENLDNAMKAYKGQYLLAAEGAVPTANNGTFLTIGSKAETGVSLIKRVAADAAAVICVGTCSSFGGVQAARPNPTGAKSVGTIIDRPVVNVAGCPPNPANITGTLMYFIMFGRLPALDIFNRPKWAYGARVHDNCERRGHFDAGEFVTQFGDDNAKQGYCLFKMGCKGPYTYNNCPTERFNAHTSWPVLAGHGCIGCSEPDFWDDMADFEKPLSRQPVHGLDATADTIGAVILGVTAVGIGAHAVSSIFAKKIEE